MHKDTVVGIAGAAILVAAMAGVFWYEGTQGALAQGSRSFAVQFAEKSGNGPTVASSAPATAGSPVNVDVNVPGNLTKIEFILVWTDDVGDPDVFKFKITPPEGLGEPQESQPTANGGDGNGEIRLTFTIAPKPGDTTVMADTDQQAKDRAAAQAARNVGMGAWEATVELVQARGQASQVPLPAGTPLSDTGNAWQIKTIVTSYAPEIKA